MTNPSPYALREVAADEWDIVRWLWQAYRGDMATVVHGLPYADGRYQARRVDRLPHPDAVAYLAWRPHPVTGEQAPIAFAVVEGVLGDERSIGAFWVAPAARRGQVGSRLAQDVIARHPGPWVIAFQRDNLPAGSFWRRVADEAFGVGGWSERSCRFRGRPQVPPDHWIRSVSVARGGSARR